MKKQIFTIFIVLTVFFSACNSSDNFSSEEQLLIDYGKVVKTLKDIASNIRQYRMQFGEYPESGTIEELYPKLKKITHPFKTSIKDPWGNPYYFIYKPEYKSEFYLYSRGSDNQFKGLEQEGRYDLTELKNGPDVIYYGFLLFWPNVDQLTTEQIKIFFKK